uniref:Uncharacterized protein n=1 Tax=candidate division WOR-3 bacterium TaxID=2052148 RepID=A0A7C3UP40_UNCW3
MKIEIKRSGELKVYEIMVTTIVCLVALSIPKSTIANEMKYIGDVKLYWGGFSENSFTHNVSVYVYPDVSYEKKLTNGSNVIVDLPEGYSEYWITLVSGCWFADWSITVSTIRSKKVVLLEKWRFTGSRGDAPCLGEIGLEGLFWSQLLKAEIVPMNQFGRHFREFYSEDDNSKWINIKLNWDWNGKTGFRLLVLAR